MRKKISVLVCVAIIGALLMSTVPALGQDAPLTILWWGGQERHDRTIAVIEMYEEETGIDIEFEFAGWGDYWTLANTKAAGGELQCIMQQDYGFLYQWQSNDQLMALDAFLEDGTIDTTNIPDAAIAGGIIEDQMYGINLGNNSQAIMIDVDAFEEAGVDLPPEDWTWDEFEATATALHDALGIWGFGGPIWDGGILRSYMLSHGQYLYAPDGSGLGFEDDALFTEYFDRILRMSESGATATFEELLAEFQDVAPEATPLAVDRAAMDYKWSNQVVAVWVGAGEDANIRLWPLPRANEDALPSNYFKPSMFFSITNNCDQPEEAAKFISFFVNDNEANEILFAERGVPISTAVQEHLQPMLEPAQLEMFEFLARIGDYNVPTPPPDPVGAPTADTDVLDPLVIQPILFGQISPAEGAEILRTEATRVFEEAR